MPVLSSTGKIISRKQFYDCTSPRRLVVHKTKKCMKAEKHIIRAKNRELRKMPYSQYLLTDDWNDKREKKLNSVETIKCQICGSTENIHIHHIKYLKRYNVSNDDLMSLFANQLELAKIEAKIEELALCDVTGLPSWYSDYLDERTDELTKQKEEIK